jgi:hypothetical protein
MRSRSTASNERSSVLWVAAQAFGQQFVVENRGGASGMIGVEVAVNAIVPVQTPEEMHKHLETEIKANLESIKAAKVAIE